MKITTYFLVMDAWNTVKTRIDNVSDASELAAKKAARACGGYVVYITRRAV
jgi:hypothetical protein